MKHRNIRTITIWAFAIPLALIAALNGDVHAEELLKIDNGTVQIGIDKDKGGSITWLSSKSYPKNIVNHSDPGRLIQQSYYAGKILDRTADGQHKGWSPWSWNPIQGGGVGSWAKAGKCQKKDNALFSETTPKLWDMPNEEAQAVMRQWTQFEPDLSNVVVVKCELVSLRDETDRWGARGITPQEVPACYFTRNFGVVKSYLGNGKWQRNNQPPGPPWGKAKPPRNVMACFTTEGNIVAVFSPTATEHWNFGPHAHGKTDDPKAGPCMHVAPISRIKLRRKSTYQYRYWLVVGDEPTVVKSLDRLMKKYSQEQAKLTE